MENLGHYGESKNVGTDTPKSRCSIAFEPFTPLLIDCVPISSELVGAVLQLPPVSVLPS